MSDTGYRIDYDNIDVQDLMSQVRDRARAQDIESLRLPEGAAAAASARVHDYLDLDDERPYEIQRALGLDGGWNVSPADLRASHPGAAGRLISGVRAALRPLTKILANTDLPLFKQFKINVGLAAAAHDLFEDNAALRQRLEEISQRLERLESATTED